MAVCISNKKRGEAGEAGIPLSCQASNRNVGIQNIETP